MDLFKSSALTPETLAEIRKLHFQTRRMATQGVSGQYRSAFRGRGIEFEEVRPYCPGDDVRSIDWKVTARTSYPHVKSYREERELTVMIAVDTSSSTLTGTRNQLRESLIARVGAVLTLIALNNNDKVGLVTYSNKLETYHPPRKGKGAVWRILREVMSTTDTPVQTPLQTDLGGLFAFLSNVIRRRAIIFVISDFFCSGFEESLGTLSKRHDVTAIVVQDPADHTLPNAGLISITDPETNKSVIIDSTDSIFRSAYEQKAKQNKEELKAIFMRHRIGTINLNTETAFMAQLQRYFDSKGGPHQRK